MLSPVDCGNARVYLLGLRSREIAERHENAARSTRPQTRTIRRLDRALEQHTKLELASVGRTAGAQLGSRQVSDPRRAGSEELHSCLLPLTVQRHQRPVHLRAPIAEHAP